MSKIYEDKERAKNLQAGQRKSSPFVDLFYCNLRKACACLGAFGRSPKVATRLAAFASVADDLSMPSTRHGAKKVILTLKSITFSYILGLISVIKCAIIVTKALQ